MKTEEKIKITDEILKSLYPSTQCFLKHSHDYELLFAIILSAQTTDIAVNKVTAKLFFRYPTLEELAAADYATLKTIIAPIGLSSVKAKNILATAGILHSTYRDILPKTREELMKLPGVGYKTATVFLAETTNFPSIPVDTHILRIVNRLNLLNRQLYNPTVISQKLDKNYRGESHIDFHRRMILFGRNVCLARHPQCTSCPFLNILCQGLKSD